LVAEQNRALLTELEESQVPVILVASSNTVRLERISDTLDSAVSIGDLDLVYSTRPIWETYLEAYASLGKMPQTTAIINHCKGWYERAVPISEKLIEQAHRTTDPDFMQALAGEMREMRSFQNRCREQMWLFSTQSHTQFSSIAEQSKINSDKAVTHTLLLGGVALFCILLIGIGVLRHVTQTVADVMNSLTSTRLAEGIAGNPIVCHAKDEIGAMVGAFNTLINELQELLGTTQKQKLQIENKNSEIEALNRQLVEQATTDRLTQLKNFAYFQEELDRRIAESIRMGARSPLSIIILDIDHFKSFNDTYGHLGGNDVLIQVAGRFRNMARKMDTPCRYGGEEFVIILPQCHLEGALTLAERIRRSIENDLFDVNEQKVPITASFGVAEYQTSETLSSFVGRADEALYLAKERGRNRVEAAPSSSA
jgi:diguanylate cyclase (GGDEF)-like protein